MAFVHTYDGITMRWCVTVILFPTLVSNIILIEISRNESIYTTKLGKC